MPETFMSDGLTKTAAHSSNLGSDMDFKGTTLDFAANINTLVRSNRGVDRA